MSTRYKLIATLTIILTLVAGCGKVQPTATPVPPTDTPAPPTATPIPPTDTPVPPTATQTPILPTTEPSPTAAPATEPGVTSNTWIKTYGGNQDILCGDVLLADDGGYFIAGTANLEFEPEVRGDVYLMRTDAAGEILWEKAYGGEGYEGGQSIILADDGNLVIAGRTTSFGVEGTDAYLIKVDQDGDEVWSKTFGGPLDEGASVVRQTADGGYILVGNIVDPNDFVADPGAAGYGGAAGRSNIYLVRTDGDGNELWSRAYDSEDNIMASSGLQTPDGGFLALATIMYFPDSGDDIYLLKVDENGNEVWSSTWEEGTIGGYDLIQTSDGNYLITGSYVPPGDTDDEKEDFLFIKVDPAGNEIWMSIFGDPDMIDYGFVLAETGDGGYVTVAERTRDRYTWDADIALVKVDENGQLLWERIRIAFHTMLSTILQHPDGGYVIAGSAFRDPVFNIMLIKTDSEGDISALPTASQTVTSMPPAATLTPALPVSQSPVVADIIASLESLPIEQFFEQSHVQLQLRDPDNLIFNGLDKEYGVASYDRLSDISDAYIRETQQLEVAVLDLLRAYDRSALSPEQQLSFDIYEWYLDDLVRGHEFAHYRYPLNSSGMWSLHFLLVSVMENVPITSKSEAEDYVVRLSQVDAWAAQLLEGLKLRQEAGIIPPRHVIQGTIPQIEMLIQTPEGASLHPRSSSLYSSFLERMREVDEISSQERQALLDAAEVEIEETFMPAFTELRDYLVRLERVAPDELGVGQFARGDEFYDYVLRHWSTIEDVSADQVHELGLAEVDRIQAEMRAVAIEMGYPADISMAEMGQLVAESEILTGEELRQEYERLIAQAEQAAQEYFDLLPSAAVVVEYDPDSWIAAYYQQPPPDGSGPGRMIVNLRDSGQYAFYNVHTLTHHEAIPGHHIQYALANELDLPKFRRDTILNVAQQYFTYESFTDGWALYAKQLAWEMGLYGDDLLSNLGRLRLFLRFATDVVVDTGIHARGWTLQQAVAYKEQTIGMTFAPRGLAKLINVPGQVCGNYLGYLKILELRQRAMDQLGDQFDIKEFHNVVLGNGPMPLEILERLVDDWIETRMNQ